MFGIYDVMVAFIRRPQHLFVSLCAFAACCVALSVVWAYRGSIVVASDSSRDSLLAAPPTPETVSLDRVVVTSRWNSSANVTGLDDVFISVKTTGVYHNTRVKLLQRTWLTLTQNQVQ